MAVLALAVFSGCGDDEEGSASSGGTATESSGGGSEGNADVTGKTIGYVDVVATAAIEKRWANAFEFAADKIGWEVQIQDAAGDQTKALTAARNFTTSGVDAIVTSSIPAEWIRPAAQAAEQNDIPLVNMITQASPGVFDADINEDATAYSQALAEALKEDYPDGAKIGILYESDSAAEVQRFDVLQSSLEGSGIEFANVKDIPVGNAPDGQKATVDMMNAEPDIEAIVAISAVFPQYILAGLRSGGNDDVKIYSWYADSVNAELMKKNDQYVAVVDSDIAKASFEAIDQLLTRFSGGEMTEQMFVDVEPFIIRREDLDADEIANDEGPVPYDELIQPYLEKWQDEYGIGG